MRTPVVFMIFRRPDLTGQVWKRIREARPEKLLVVADGPRDEGEAEDCQKARRVTEEVDWPCEVLRNYSAGNLGCRERVVSGLNWAFQEVDEAIVLEDDCLPDSSFFPFCEELLERFRQEPEVMMISGNWFGPGPAPGGHSYDFTIFAHIWGWATWRRAWRQHDPWMRDWPRFCRSAEWTRCFPERRRREYWQSVLDRAYAGAWAWDHPWWFTCLRHGYCIEPAVNLVKNLGWGESATHTQPGGSAHPHPPAERMKFPLIHPPKVGRNDRWERAGDPTVYPEAESRGGGALVEGVRGWLRKQSWWKWVRNSDYRRKERELARLRCAREQGHQVSKLLEPGISFTHGPTLATLYEEIFVRELYGFDSANDRPLILDGGANIGLAVLYWKRLFPGAQIKCFEPDPSALRCLRENIERHGLTGIEVHEAALGAATREVWFELRGGAGGRLGERSEGGHGTMVRQVRLREFLHERVDLLKLDVEGAEVEVLEDCHDALGRVARLYVEYHKFCGQKCRLIRLLQILEEAGFECLIESNVMRDKPFEAKRDWDGISMALHIFAQRR